MATLFRIPPHVRAARRVRRFIARCVAWLLAPRCDL